MKIRTQLLLGFLLLAALPMAAIVLYTYASSLSAFRQAVADEAEALTEEMRHRLGEARGVLDQRVAQLARLPLSSLVAPDEAAAEAGRVYSDLVAEIGDVAAFVESFEYMPSSAEAAADAADAVVIYPSRTLAEALERLQERSGPGLGEVGIAPGFLAETVGEAIRQRRQLEDSERAALAAREAQTKLLLGTEFRLPVERDGRVVGYFTAHVRAYPVLRQVLAATRRQEGEVPYARDAEGNLYVADPGDREVLAGVGVVAGPRPERPAEREWGSGDWIVAEPEEGELGLTFGIARPVGAPLREIRRTALRNFLLGLGAIGLALTGIALLSRRMTRHLGALTRGAERMATGDLTVRVPVRSRDELGQLADTFNRMAQELAGHQHRLLEQEVQQRLLAVENERRGAELEAARQFQLALLPRRLPRPEGVEVAGLMRTATEVGGDYYDFLEPTPGVLVAGVGDATGHGARPGTMVSVVKGLFTLGAGDPDLAAFLERANRAVKRMGLERMQMGLTVARLEGDELTLASGGMPPALLAAPDGAVEEVLLEGMPLGGVAGFRYPCWRGRLAPGATLLLLSDGLPEALDEAGEVFGYGRLHRLFGQVAGLPPRQVVERLGAAASDWLGGGTLRDDMTFVVLRRR